MAVVVGKVDPKNIDELQRVLGLWENSVKALEVAKETEMNLRKLAFTLAAPDAKEGTNRVELFNGYELKGVRKVNYTLDKDLAKVRPIYDAICKTGNEGAFLADLLFKWSCDIAPGEYKKLDTNNPSHTTIKTLIDTILTTKDGAPTLEIVPPKKK